MEEQEIIINSFINELRKKRDTKLQETDKYMITDFPISNDNKLLIIQYRQNLRDYIQTLRSNTSNITYYDELMPVFPLNTPNIL